MGLGLVFKLKGQGNLSRWGMLIAISGASAAIAGVGTGEMFGFHIDHIQPFEGILEEGGALHSVSWLVGAISVAELDFDQVIMILKVSLFLGIIHILWAFALHIKKLYQDGHKTTMITEAIPNVTLYGGIVVIMMCAIGSGYDVMNMYSKIHVEAVPWVTVFLRRLGTSLDYYKNCRNHSYCINCCNDDWRIKTHQSTSRRRRKSRKRLHGSFTWKKCRMSCTYNQLCSAWNHVACTCGAITYGK